MLALWAEQKFPDTLSHNGSGDCQPTYDFPGKTSYATAKQSTEPGQMVWDIRKR